MITTGIDNGSLLSVYPALSNYYPSGETTYDNQITEALRQIVRELKKNKKDLKRYCTPLPLQASITKTADFSGTFVSDSIDRMLWQVVVSAFTSDCSFNLYGSNDGGVTEDLVGTLIFTEADTKYLVFVTTYKSYSVRIVTSGSTTYKSDLIETSFYHAHLWLAVSLACKTIVKSEGDRFDYLSKEYETRYLDELNSMVATYDEDSSGDIDTDTEIDKPNTIQFLR